MIYVEFKNKYEFDMQVSGGDMAGPMIKQP